MKINRLEISRNPFLLSRNFEKLIILHDRMMQFVETPDEIVKICQSVLVKTNRCGELKLANTRDSIRELILFAQRRGHIESLINHCESIYPQFNLNKYRLEDVFSKPVDETKYHQVNQLLQMREDFRESLVDFLARLSSDDLRQLAFLLGNDVEMIGYGSYIGHPVNLGHPSEEEIKERATKIAKSSKGKDRLEVERELRKIYTMPTEQEMRKTLSDAHILNDEMDLTQLQYEFKCLFATRLIDVFENVERVTTILTAYLQV